MRHWYTNGSTGTLLSRTCHAPSIAAQTNGHTQTCTGERHRREAHEILWTIVRPRDKTSTVERSVLRTRIANICHGRRCAKESLSDGEAKLHNKGYFMYWGVSRGHSNGQKHCGRGALLGVTRCVGCVRHLADMSHAAK